VIWGWEITAVGSYGDSSLVTRWVAKRMSCIDKEYESPVSVRADGIIGPPYNGGIGPGYWFNYKESGALVNRFGIY